jgi:sugar-specific transcriptional regulator TrmB
MIEKLKRLGLTGYEAHAFSALLKLGSADAGEIARRAKVPVGRIYGVLSSLEEARLIRIQSSRPKKYACVEHRLALERLSNNKLEELKTTTIEIETLVKDIEVELSGMQAKKHTNKFWTVALREEALELMREEILGAQTELLFFMACRKRTERIKTALDEKRYDAIIEALNMTLDKGVDVKVILNKSIDFGKRDHIPAIRELLKHIGCEFNCRFADSPATPFDVIDSENVLLQMRNPLNPEELFAIIKIKDAQLAEELRERFFAIWEKAEEYPQKSR